MAASALPMSGWQAEEFLRHADLEVTGRITRASNTTLLAALDLDGVQAAAVYKPIAGERPLWDFPDGSLASREVAAYLVSQATGWGIVPPTVLRDGPAGPGMCQLWVNVDLDCQLVDVVPARAVPPGWRHVLDARDIADAEVSIVHADHPTLRRMAVLDVIINNADRKGGHVLVGADEQGQERPDEVYGVDHGVSFHVDDKLRTVLWGWAGEPLPPECRSVAEALATDLAPAATSGLRAQLDQLLTVDEVDAAAARAHRLAARARHPRPGARWPAVPWPLF